MIEEKRLKKNGSSNQMLCKSDKNRYMNLCILLLKAPDLSVIMPIGKKWPINREVRFGNTLSSYRYA